ncbi:hypothetical protein O0I10_004555 [Lichtheimia ornata]|uniref:SET domain-containing protein n=1 Tax=Lichtheimia ornata TaxID=688661 RepID=A0AAD7V6N6_9FUNG|nr:uncharacterized protein O0I10_004555 [Lichtheimia ornata]KAJ8659578.1 hypothetical protein O0I10_004555 [Lichtheimia ornata]
MTCSPPLTTTEDATPNNRPLLTVKLDNDSKRKSDFVCADYQTRNKKARSTVILQETYRRRSAPPETAEASPRPARRPSLPSPTTTSTNNNLQAPRWHSQAYLLFLALKQHPAKCLPRTELIRAALELDEKISKEYKLPRLFRGKTPMNSASAILSNNIDRYFVPFRPDGSRCMHFRLAYDPSNYKDAVRVYKQWESRLAREGWPIYFGQFIPVLAGKWSSRVQPAATEFDAFILARRQEGLLDTSQVPKSWHDLVKVVNDEEDEHKKKLIAVRQLPANTPLGFYFGVPMCKDEFNSFKDGLGEASERCVLYRNIILDATDDRGEIFQKEVFCPFHFMRESTNAAHANMLLLEGTALNQVICWTRREIAQGEELMLPDRRNSFPHPSA